MQISPEKIETLNKDNELFVFGSNTEGRHGAGAALTAHRKFGAIYGVGKGIAGSSYAIPTRKFIQNGKNWELKSLTLLEINNHVSDFLKFASVHKEYKFFVTEIGCGHAGYTPDDIAPLFFLAKKMDNVFLPKRFVKILETITEK